MEPPSQLRRVDIVTETTYHDLEMQGYTLRFTTYGDGNPITHQVTAIFPDGVELSLAVRTLPTIPNRHTSIRTIDD